MSFKPPLFSRRHASTALLSLAAAPVLSHAAAEKKPKQKPAAKKPATPPRAATTATRPAPWAGREDFERFIVAVAQRRSLPEPRVRRHLLAAEHVQRVRELIMPPPAGTAKNWAAYRARFIEPVRLQAGLRWWAQHARWLERAHERWGVPPELVVSIIGIETLYGAQMGSFRVLDTLATLGFDFPPGRRDRTEFFRGELEELVVLAEREGIAASSLRGSFAGALGLPQFMPGSVNRWAVDFDDDGHIDLHGQRSQPPGVDSIGSVAHYLASFGWQRDMPTHFEVAVPVDTADRAFLLGPDILPSFTAEQFAQRGAVLSPAGQQHVGLLALVEMQNGTAAPSYYAGTTNFWAITRYNWSSYYAFAVIDFAAELKAQRR